MQFQFFPKDALTQTTFVCIKTVIEKNLAPFAKTIHIE